MPHGRVTGDLRAGPHAGSSGAFSTLDFVLLDSFPRTFTHPSRRRLARRGEPPAQGARPAKREPVQSNCQTVDITADLNGEDETGFARTFLDEAGDPPVIAPGAMVIAGMPVRPRGQACRDRRSPQPTPGSGEQRARCRPTGCVGGLITPRRKPHLTCWFLLAGAGFEPATFGVRLPFNRIRDRVPTHV